MTTTHGIVVCLLDCSDFVRIERLNKRGTYGANQDMLNWAAWLRMHSVDPQWHQAVIKEACWEKMQWNRWDMWQKSNVKWNVTHVIDSTTLSVEDVAKHIADWIASEVKKQRNS